MKSSWRSPDGGSSVTPNTKIEPSEAVFCAWWSTASTPIRSFHTVSEGEFSEVRPHRVLRGSRQVFASGIMLAVEGVARQPSARGRSNPYVVGEKTPTHHVLRLNLCARVDSLAPTRRPSGHHSCRPRLGLGPPGLKRPILTSDPSYGSRLGQGISTQAPRS